MTPALFILAQVFGGGGFGGGGLLSHTIVGVVASVLSLGTSYLTTRGTRVTASDTWVREQFATFVSTQKQENAALKENTKLLEKRIDELEVSIRVKESELLLCETRCGRLRRERDVCRESHKALYDLNEQLRKRVQLSVPIEQTLTPPPAAS